MKIISPLYVLINHTNYDLILKQPPLLKSAFEIRVKSGKIAALEWLNVAAG